ncbi:hypothetical protein GQ53DRAFT_728820 [Thozetella sp. PMI_491]|nr:hypothetical protein GQ53DRAFT_728820 [Thozetella sp. PMI_491]
MNSASSVQIDRVPVRRTHRKSRNGCFQCKRRRVKCDEERPCNSCVRFSVPCEYRDASQERAASTTVYAVPSTNNSQSGSGPALRRGRGRPRKDWTGILASMTIREPASRSSSESRTTSATMAADSEASACRLNVDDVGLMHHFTTRTAQTLSGSDDRTTKIAGFWIENVPRIGMTHHFVLHLALGVAALHLAHLTSDESLRRRYRDLGERHSSTGLSELNESLPLMDETNCGALYVAATLVCYCSFAAGPSGDGDLLVFHNNSNATVHWLTLIRGVRYIREMVSPEVLFSGLMDPLKPGPAPEAPSPEQVEPTMYKQKYERVDWEEPLQRLHDFITKQDGGDQAVQTLQALENLSRIFEATYGKADGSSDSTPEDQFIFGWLYRLEADYVACLQQNYAPALIVLGYYTVLLRLTERIWLMLGWSDHILKRIRAILDGKEQFVQWLKWPTELLGLEWEATD